MTSETINVSHAGLTLGLGMTYVAKHMTLQIHTVCIKRPVFPRLQTDGNLISNKHAGKSVQSPAKQPPAARGH